MGINKSSIMIKYLPTIAVALFTSSGDAQVTETTTVVPAAPARSTIITNVAPAVQGTVTVERFDPVVAQRVLSVAPRALPVTQTQPATVNQTVTVESHPAAVQRVYNVERQVVIVEAQGKTIEMPFVTVPVLFVVDTADLLSAESREALQQTAATINGIAQMDPNAQFAIEGHTSTEGGKEHNLKLSADRAARVLTELTERYKVPATALTAAGYGEKYAMHPDGTEPELQLDRRVLVVRTR